MNNKNKKNSIDNNNNKNLPHQSQTYQQQIFNLSKYNQIQQILEQLLNKLKYTLKQIKNNKFIVKNKKKYNIKSNNNIEINNQEITKRRGNSLIDIISRRKAQQVKQIKHNINLLSKNDKDNANMSLGELKTLNMNNTKSNKNYSRSSSKNSSQSHSKIRLKVNSTHNGNINHNNANNNYMNLNNNQNNNKKKVAIGLGNLLGDINSNHINININNQSNNNNSSQHQNKQQQQYKQQHQKYLISRNKINQLLSSNQFNNNTKNITNNNSKSIYHRVQNKKNSTFYNNKSNKTKINQIQLHQQKVFQKSSNNNNNSLNDYYQIKQTPTNASQLSYNNIKNRRIIKSNNIRKDNSNINNNNINMTQNNVNYNNNQQYNNINSFDITQFRQTKTNKIDINNTNNIPIKIMQKNNKIDKDKINKNQYHEQEEQLNLKTLLLKSIKNYLQIIASGQVDNIQALLDAEYQYIYQYNNNIKNNKNNNQSQINNQKNIQQLLFPQLFDKKKLFKTALYYQRASIISGVCYGYLIIAKQNGQLLYNSANILLNNGQKSIKDPKLLQFFNQLKQNTKQILKYLINLVSFSLNNNKIISSMLKQYISINNNSFNEAQHTKKQSIQSNNNNLNISQINVIKKPSYNNNKLQIQRQILRRNIQTIKLNLQYTQQTFMKIFSMNFTPLTSHTSSSISSTAQRDILMSLMSSSNNTMNMQNNNISSNSMKQIQNPFPQAFKTISKILFGNIGITNSNSVGNTTNLNNHNNTNINNIQHSNTSSIQQTFYMLLQYFAYYLSLIKKQKWIPYLAVAPNPYIHQEYNLSTDHQFITQGNKKKYTLIIDFIQIFCHGTKTSKNHIFRPYSYNFISQMSQYYNIILWSNALPQQIDKIIDIFDPKSIVKYRLYKHHMIQDKYTGNYLKAIQRVGTDLMKTIMIDVENNQTIESNNTIYIKQWKGSKNDTSLAQLCSILASISVQKLDCQKAAFKINQQMKINLNQGIKYINFGLNLKQLKNNKNEKIHKKKQEGQSY